jgi:hypothetical protein
MPKETAISLKNRTDKHQAKQNNRNVLIPRGPLQRKNCWSPKENTAFLDTVVHGWDSTPIYIMQKERETEDDDDDEEEIEDHIFDGAHKVEAVIKFINGDYVIDKVEDISPIKDYYGKKFNELPKVIRDKILNYEFTLNIIDYDTAHDADSLKTLWERLNKGGKQLNKYELALPVIHDLVKNVLEPSSVQFFGTDIYQKKESKRGQLENLLQMIIALSESTLPEYTTQFNSKKQLIKLWQDSRLGKKKDEITRNITEKKVMWLDNLKLACDYLKVLSENNCFIKENGQSQLQNAHRGTELIFLLGRLIAHFPKAEEFRRIAPELANKMKEKFFLTIQRDAAGRNGGTQRRILKEVDNLVLEYTKLKAPRTFTKAQIKDKFIEQNGKCAICKTDITKVQKYVGDHIIPWSLGGTSESSNCQVTHERCNLIKGDKIQLNDLSQFTRN